MIHIILLILKILGCIILGILALLLAALLIVLFVPFRYELSAAYDGAPEAFGKLSWLFGALRVRGSFKDKKLQARASVLWFRVFSMGGETAEAAGDAEKAADDTAEILEEDFDSVLEVPENIPESGTASDKPVSPDLNNPISPEASAEPESPASSKTLGEPGHTASSQAPVETGIKSLPKPKKKAKKEKKPKPKKPGLGERLSKFFERLKKKISSAEKQYEKLVYKKELLERFWNAEFTQRSIVFAKKALFSILRHLRPKDLSGNIHFGFDKPSDTGKVLGYASILYAWYGNSLKLYPDFEKTALDGDIHIQGSVRLYIFLYWGLRGLLNKDLRKLLKYIKHYKGKEETLWQ